MRAAFGYSSGKVKGQGIETLSGSMNKHLEMHSLMARTQRGARAGCSGTIDNLLIDRTVTLDCHR